MHLDYPAAQAAGELICGDITNTWWSYREGGATA